MESLQARHARWRQSRHDELAGPDSWLGLAGLFWLEAGANRVGSADDCPVRLPFGPAHLGDLDWRGGRIVWQPVGAAPVELASDRDGAPTTVEHGRLAFFVVERDGRLVLRLRDRGWAGQLPFSGIDCFDFEPAWRIAADWQPLQPPVAMELPNVSGELKTVEVAWRAVFEVEGRPASLLPVSVGDNEVFFVFRDRTSGPLSYGAGRFLKAKPAVDGRIVLDFNRAFNPPCAFTPFATCPLPPPENWLPFAVPAGEMKWVKPGG